MPTLPLIRARKPEDLDACVAALREVHADSRYPLLWPRDPSTWLTPPQLLAAWVALEDATVAGHVALSRPEEGSHAEVWAATCQLPVQSLATVDRLFVAPRARGRGLGRALLARAQTEARARGRRATLEVLDSDGAAISLYEREGWLRVASRPALWAWELSPDTVMHYYLAPR